jgi:hypothetical protein
MKKTNNKTRQINIRLNNYLFQSLELYCEKKELSKQTVITDALNKYLFPDETKTNIRNNFMLNIQEKTGVLNDSIEIIFDFLTEMLYFLIRIDTALVREEDQKLSGSLESITIAKLNEAIETWAKEKLPRRKAALFQRLFLEPKDMEY